MSFRVSLPRPLFLLLALLAIFITFGGLDERKLANPDEGRYSEISREMAASGDFVTPRLNGLKYFEKPPLQYWATAVSFSLFGENEFTARLYTALSALGCILLVAYTGKRIFDEETGMLAGLVMLSAPYFAIMSEVVTLDMGLTFWMTLTMSSVMISQHTSTEISRRRWLCAAWAGMAAAVLSKGLIGIVFPAGTVFLYCVFQRNFRLLWKLEWLAGSLIFFAITVPWFVLVSIKNPEFPQFFFIHEHVERFLSTVHRREQPWWFFVPILFLGFLPWVIAFIPACVQGWQRPAHVCRESGTFAPHKFVLIYSVFILLFFSKSGSKLPHYILPMFPVLALVISTYVRAIDAKRLAWLVLPVLPLALLGAYAAWVAPDGRNPFSRQLYADMSVWVVGAALSIALAVIASFSLMRAQRKWLGVLVLCLGTIVGMELIERGYERISPLQSSFALSESIKLHLTPETRLYSVGNYEQSLPFYLKRTLTLVDYIDEFEMGQKSEPAKWIAKLGDFAAAWNAPGAAIAIIAPLDIDKIRALGVAFDVIHKDPRRVAIMKRQSL
jgi:4-amino-4-deoxy-L-arabinose transferase-like glycosyltransferase